MADFWLCRTVLPPGGGPEARSAKYDYMFVLDKGTLPHPSVAEIARQCGQAPVDVVIDLTSEKGTQQFFLRARARDAVVPGGTRRRGAGPSRSGRVLRRRQRSACPARSRSTGAGFAAPV